MSDIPTIAYFEFADGLKRIDECTREELLIVVGYLANEVERLRDSRAAEASELVNRFRAAYPEIPQTYAAERQESIRKGARRTLRRFELGRR